MRTAIRGSIFVLLACLLASVSAAAAEITVVSVGALGTGMKAIVADFTRETGTKVNLVLTNPTAVNQALDGGKPVESINSDKPVDVLVAALPSMTQFDKRGAFKSGSRKTLLRVGIGVGIKEGSAAPNLSSPAAFKRAILQAKTVTYGDPTQANGSGINVQRVLSKAGVWQQAQAKGKVEGLGAAKELVAKGNADLGLFNASETAGPGVVLAGEAPRSLQAYTTYAAAIPARSADAADAARFIRFMASGKNAWRAAHVDMAAK